jgi:hypothetical protein
MMIQLRAILSLATLLALSACATTGDYPSLAKRSFETVAAEPPAPPPAPIIPADASLQTRIAAALTLAQNGAGAFAAALADANSKANVALGAASESWIAAQLSLSRAERTLEPAANALANLDSEKTKLMLASPASPDMAALDAAIGQVAEINATQSEALSRLGARLSR